MSLKSFFKGLIGKCRCIFSNVKSGKNVYVGKGTKLLGKKNITLCDNVQIRPFCDIYAGDYLVIGSGSDIGTRSRIAGNVIIEDDVLFGPNVFVCRYDHEYRNVNTPIILQKEYQPNRNGHKDLKIGSGTWIGINSVIIGDVHIGKHCVIAANSVITKDIPDFCVVAGAPAKIIKVYDKIENRWIKYEERT